MRRPSKKIYWEPRELRLNRQELASKLKQGAELAGVAISPGSRLERLMSLCLMFTPWLCRRSVARISRNSVARESLSPVEISSTASVRRAR